MKKMSAYQTFKVTKSFFIFKYNFHLRRTIPLREHFLTVKETVKENVPVDTDSVIHKLRLLLKFSCNWCTVYEHNFTQSAPFHVTKSP